MDELGSGTDPAEGMGIAMAILERLRLENCLFLATTHYPEIKDYAKQAEGVINARMAFDRESLRPLYCMELGEAGESCALYIAEKLGMPEEMLEYARHAAYGQPDAPHASCGSSQMSCGKLQDRKGRKAVGPRIQKTRDKRGSQIFEPKFKRGDSVQVLPDKRIGIVCKPDDASGRVLVQLPEGKKEINQKRLCLHVKAEELYPDDYDFSIIFDTVENRKARHKMGKKYQPGLTVPAEET